VAQRSELERLCRQLCGGSRVGDAEGLRCLVHRGDRGVVAWIGALDELLCDLDGERTTREQNIDRLSVKGPPDRR
jgi:hypothetical protein